MDEREFPSFDQSSTAADMWLIVPEIKPIDISIIVEMLSNKGVEIDDFGPVVTAGLEELKKPARIDQQAKRLATLFGITREERLHPLTGIFLEELYKKHDINTDSFRDELIAKPERRIAVIDRTVMASERDTEERYHKIDRRIKLNKANYFLNRIEEPSWRLQFRRYIERWISQALIYIDEAHLPVYGDPAKAAGWLRLMKESKFFYEEMLYLGAINLIKASYNVPPVQIYSPQFKGFSYFRLLDIFHNLGEEGLMEQWEIEQIGKKISRYTNKVQTTGFGRNANLIDQIAELAPLLEPGFGENNVENSIINFGSGMVQTAALIAGLREKLTGKVHLGDGHISIDAQSLAELSKDNELYQFTTTTDGKSVLSKNHKILTSEEMRLETSILDPNYNDYHIQADISEPLPKEAISKIELIRPTVAIATNSIIPHLSPEDQVKAMTSLLSTLKRQYSLVHISGGYIGVPSVVEGITAIMKIDRSKISLIPVYVNLGQGWQTESNMQVIHYPGAREASPNAPLTGISAESKICFHEDRLPFNGRLTQSTDFLKSTAEYLEKVELELRQKERFSLPHLKIHDEKTFGQWMEYIKKAYDFYSAKRKEKRIDKVTYMIIARDYFFYGIRPRKLYQIYLSHNPSNPLSRNAFDRGFLGYIRYSVLLQSKRGDM